MFSEVQGVGNSPAFWACCADQILEIVLWGGLGAPEGWCSFRILETVGLPSWGGLFWATTLPKALGLSIEAQDFRRLSGS